MSSGLESVERFLAGAGFDRAPWLVVAFGTGIAAWFMLPYRPQWFAFIAASLGCAIAAQAVMREHGRHPYLRQALSALALMLAAGCATVWFKSVLAGTPGIARPVAGTFDAVVLGRQEQPALDRTRLIVLLREPGGGRLVRIRVNVPRAHDTGQAREGALIRMRARLMPPAGPMLPGGYDFARTAWFSGISATGSVLAPLQVVHPGVGDGGLLGKTQRGLANHIHEQVDGSAGGIAAAFASGDRGGIVEGDEAAMRDAGLTHLLSVSGLHVSAVIGAVYLLALRLLALWPWLALRVRLPLLAAVLAAGTGIFYTLLTGAEVPTVRSVAGALLVLIAVALGREPLSLRLLAVAGFGVMLVWPETVVGPSFQLSFGAVLAIVALHSSAPMRAWRARREGPWWLRGLHHLGEVLLTGVVIELALMPMTLFHFHRAGLYGALANVIAIPLTTFVTMPLIAAALLLDTVGAGAPAWWAVARSIEMLLGIAHLVARQPGAVTLFPSIGAASYGLFLAGGFWLALWRGPRRLWGLAPVLAGTFGLLSARPPDVLISGDGRHVGFTGVAADTLLVLRDTRSDYARENLSEIAGMSGTLLPLTQWPGARCNDDFCALDITRGQRTWRFLLARGSDPVPLRDLAAACERADVVIADRRLPAACRPAFMKADRRLLERTGGMAIDLSKGRIETVAARQGDHGWWQPRVTFRPARRPLDPAGLGARPPDGTAVGTPAPGAPDHPVTAQVRPSTQ
ncbi:MAG: ComEC/Rec2 family competence protein [Pseudomonadota bacterium]